MKTIVQFLLVLSTTLFFHEASAQCWSKVYAGNRCTYAIRQDGTLWSWGENSTGMLGHGTFVNTLLPTQVGTDNNWSKLDVGENHVIALKTNGTVWTWGVNGTYQLGNGTNALSTTPIQVQPTTGTTFIDVAAADGASYALTADGRLYAVGNNNFGQMAQGTSSQTVFQSWVLASGGNLFTKVSAGGITVAAIKTDGTLWMCGNIYSQMVNLFAQIGTDTYTNIFQAYQHTLAIKTNGTLWGWGNNSYGQTGSVGVGGVVQTPNQIGTATNWANITGSINHSLGVRADGTLWAWGRNNVGQLANGNTTNLSAPTQVGTLTSWATVAAGEGHTAATQTSNQLLVCGWNAYGQLGLNTTADVATLTAINCQSIIGNCWSKISAGFYHNISIKADGTLWAWGRNNAFQLGDGTTFDRSIPVQIGGASNWAQVAAGEGHSLAIKTDGTLWAWGWNASGQLGHGSTTTYASPVQVGSATNWKFVYAGARFSIGIKTDGTLWAWGDNANGQLGINSTASVQTSPVQVGTATNWSMASAGGSHVVALRTDGTLWTWGLGGSGQLGIGTFGSSPTPLQIGTDNTWRTVAAGASFSFGIKSNGTLWAWGDNNANQINYTGLVATVPVQINASTGAAYKNIFSGSGANHAFALTTTNLLHGWGLNGSYQLGTTAVTPATLQTYGTDNTWHSISCGPLFTSGVKQNASRFYAGNNNYYALGDGNGTFYLQTSFATINCTANITLPVTINNFNGKRIGNSNYLYWSTIAETNNNGFAIERSTDGINFTQIGFVKGKGNSQTQQQYSFNDDPSQGNVFYYRLKQIDADGKYHYSSIIKLQHDKASNYSLYPVPAKEKLFIQGKPLLANQIKIINALGAQMPANVANNSIDIHQLPAGLYHLIITEAGNISSLRFIKN